MLAQPEGMQAPVCNGTLLRESFEAGMTMQGALTSTAIEPTSTDEDQNAVAGG